MRRNRTTVALLAAALALTACAELLFARQADLVKVHPEAANIKRDLAPRTEPVPLHPGAQRYYGGS